MSKGPEKKQCHDLHCLHTAEVSGIRASFWLSADRLQVLLDAQYQTPNDSKTFSEKELQELLGPLSGKTCLTSEVVHHLLEQLSSGKNVQKFCLAQGTPPQIGQTGRVEFAVSIVPGTIAEDACVLKPVTLKKVTAVLQGQLLATFFPPTVGPPGIDALGNKLPGIKGAEASALETDKTVSLVKLNEPHGALEYRAKHAGIIFEHNSQLSIAKSIIVDGHINVHSGPIDVPCRVEVRGNIMKGLHVHAGEDILVKEDVYGGSLASENGSIKLLGHLAGENESRIIAAKEICVDIVQEASLEAAGDIIAKTEIRDCVIRTSSRLLVPKGHLLGGSIHARYGVEASTIGSVGGSRTRINMLQEVSSTEEFRDLASKLREHESGISRFENALGALASYSDEDIEKNRSDIKPLIPAILSYRQLLQSKKSIEEEMEILLAKDQKRVAFRVNFLSEIHQQVVIIAGRDKYIVQQTIQGPGTVEYLASKNLFHVGEYRKLSEPQKG